MSTNHWVNMDVFRSLFVKPSDSEATPIDDYFKTQRFFLRFMGVWPLSTASNGTVRNLLKIAKIFQQMCIVLIMLHVAIVFAFSFYIENSSGGSFARISFALSQVTIFSFTVFSQLYMMVKADEVTSMMNDMNKTFKYRSAKGKI